MAGRNKKSFADIEQELLIARESEKLMRRMAKAHFEQARQLRKQMVSQEALIAKLELKRAELSK